MTATFLKAEPAAPLGLTRQIGGWVEAKRSMIRKRRGLGYLAHLDRLVLDDIGVSDAAVDRTRFARGEIRARREQRAQLDRIAAHIPPTVFWR